MINFNGFPSGVWKRNNDGYEYTYFENADLFAANGVAVPAHPTIESIVPSTTVGFIAPATDIYTDAGLNNTNTVLQLANMKDYFNNSLGFPFSIDSSYILEPGQNSGSASSSGSSVNPGASSGAGAYTPGNVSGGWDWSSSGVNGGSSSSGVNGSSGNNGVNSSNNTSNAGGAASGDFVNNEESNTPQAQFNSRLKLIKQYCDKYGQTVDIDEIKQKYANDPEGGVKYCDNIINNKFNQSKVEKIVKTQYKEKLDAQLEKGQSISDDWVETAIKNGTATPNFNTSGVNKNNVLDVIGTFMTNEEVKNGKVSLENIFEQPDAAKQLMNAIKAKANEMLKRKDIDDETKESIAAKLEDLVEYVDNFSEKHGNEFVSSPFQGSASRRQAVSKYTELFTELRTVQAQKNDEAAREYYGLPEDSGITLTTYTDRANEEIKAHKNRRKLRVNI